ncbi:MAG: DUF1501 domain-containing protein [Pirellulaceae bacterium]
MTLSSFRRCDGIPRRDAIRIGSLGALGWTMFGGGRRSSAAERIAPGRARACILLWLDGGPSHLETFDLKPDTPSEVRGPFQPIATRIPGVQICELLPRTAQLTDKMVILRSLTSPLGEHGLANQYLLSGYKPSPVLEYPSYGAVAAHVRGGGQILPPYVAIPDVRPPAGAGFLGSSCEPFAVGGDPARADFRVKDLEFYTGVGMDRVERRRAMLGQLERFQQSVESQATASPQDAGFEQAYRLVTSPQAKRAFDLAAEKDEVRARYGPRTFGQSCLLARRLIESGVGFVTVNYIGWDTHESLILQLKEGYTGARVGVGLVPTFDQAFSALVEDLDQRGLLDETLVIAMGEFGRTPKLNTRGGRDHWPRVFSVVMAGGGIPGGQVIGRSDRIGESPADRPVNPADLACTIYRLLGIDPASELHTPDGRPVQINQGGQALSELVA